MCFFVCLFRWSVDFFTLSEIFDICCGLCERELYRWDYNTNLISVVLTDTSIEYL